MSLKLEDKDKIQYLISHTIKRFPTFSELIENIKINNRNLSASKKGFIYERIWDICIKFGVTKFTNIESEFVKDNINNNLTFYKFNKESFEDYLKTSYISGNSGGFSDISFTPFNI